MVTTTPTPEAICERLRELLAKATPRPWKASPYRGCTGSQVWAGEPGPNAVLICAEGDAEDADAELIAEAVNSLPDLLARIEHLSALLREAEEGGKWMRLALKAARRSSTVSGIHEIIDATLAKLKDVK